MLTQFQKELLLKLYEMKDNFGPNIIQASMRVRVTTSRRRETVLGLPVDVDPANVGNIYFDSPEVEKLFDACYLEHIPGQNEEFFCLGEKGLAFCEKTNDCSDDGKRDGDK